MLEKLPHQSGAVMVSVIVTIGFFVMLAVLIFVKVDASAHDMIMTLVGLKGGAFANVVNYWLGSSSGSKAKDAQIASLSQLAAAADPSTQRAP